MKPQGPTVAPLSNSFVRPPAGLPEGQWVARAYSTFKLISTSVFIKAAKYDKKSKAWADSVLVKATYSSFTELRIQFLRELGCKATDKAEIFYKLYPSDSNHAFSEDGHFVAFFADVFRRETALRRQSKQAVTATVWLVSTVLFTHKLLLWVADRITGT